MPNTRRSTRRRLYTIKRKFYIYPFDNKVYLECIPKCMIHNLVQKFDRVISCDIIQDFEIGKEVYSLERHIELKEDGTSTINTKLMKKLKIKMSG